MNGEDLEVKPTCDNLFKENAKKLLTEIRFNCVVTMYDYGCRQTGGGFLQQPKSLPPQWFVLSETFTLDFIRTSDEYQLGRAMKLAYEKLVSHIKQYEKTKL